MKGEIIFLIFLRTNGLHLGGKPIKELLILIF